MDDVFCIVMLSGIISVGKIPLVLSITQTLLVDCSSATLAELLRKPISSTSQHEEVIIIYYMIQLQKKA